MGSTTVIIGAGHAGGEAAIQLRKAGYEGAITIIGEEPYAPYERPPLSKDLLSGDMALERLFLRPAGYYAEHRIDILTGRRASAIDRERQRVLLQDGEALAYDALIIATGARVRRLPLPGADLPGIHVIRTIDDTLALRPEMKAGARLAVIGGGYIGLEAAAVARKLGLEVTVFEAADRVMARTASPPVSDFYAAYHRAQGVDIRLGQSIKGFAGDSHVTGIQTTDGETHAADIVILCVGVIPNSDIAEAAGLTVDNGIVVDAHCRTNDPAIYAIGDVSRHPNPIYGDMLRLESVHNAMAQARIAALAITGQPEAYAEVPWFWSNQYDLRLQIAGVGGPGDEIVLRGEAGAPGFSVAHLRGGRLAALEAVNNPRDFMAAKKLIAAGTAVDAARIADSATPLKDLL